MASKGFTKLSGLLVGQAQRLPNFPSFYLLLDKEKEKFTLLVRLRPGEVNLILLYFI